MTKVKKTQKNKFEKKYSRMRERYSAAYNLRPPSISAWFFYYTLKIITSILGIVCILLFIASMVNPVWKIIADAVASASDKIAFDKYGMIVNIAGYIILMLGIMFFYIAHLCEKMLGRIFYILELEDILNA